MATATLLALLIVTRPAEAAFPGENGKIAFGAGNFVEDDIYTMNPDGTEVTNLTNSPSRVLGPAWSPDGQRLAFWRLDLSTGSRDIYMMDKDGTNEQHIGEGEEPAWSPDGRKIAFSSQRDGDHDIYVSDTDGTNVVQLTDEPSWADFDDTSPAWSPLGDKIAFMSERSGWEAIWLTNPDGSAQTQLTFPVFGNHDLDPAWSPDGKRLTFRRGGDPGSGIWVIDEDGSDETRLSSGYDVEPAWSPDGTGIVFARSVNCEFCWDLFRFFADGTGLYRLTNDAHPYPESGEPERTYYDPDWQPLPRSYPRPKSAATEWVSLLPAYKPCTAPNSTHGSPLAAPSCSPPLPVSDHLTVGTADSNRKPTKSNGSLLTELQLGDPATPEDEADVKLTFGLKDVRNESDLSDYTGELLAAEGVRITDKYNGYGGGAATAQDLPYSFTVPCAATTDTTIGSDCALTTTADTLVPGTIREGKRAVWDLGQLRLYDGGSDGLASTAADNTLFMTQGIFVP
jgi:Tol biopolymer transport system component